MQLLDSTIPTQKPPSCWLRKSQSKAALRVCWARSFKAADSRVRQRDGALRARLGVYANRVEPARRPGNARPRACFCPPCGLSSGHVEWIGLAFGRTPQAIESTEVVVMGFSMQHLLLFAVIALLLFGGRGKISEIMGDFAKGIKSFKKG